MIFPRDKTVGPLRDIRLSPHLQVHKLWKKGDTTEMALAVLAASDRLIVNWWASDRLTHARSRGGGGGCEPSRLGRARVFLAPLPSLSSFGLIALFGSGAHRPRPLPLAAAAAPPPSPFARPPRFPEHFQLQPPSLACFHRRRRRPSVSSSPSSRTEGRLRDVSECAARDPRERSTNAAGAAPPPHPSIRRRHRVED